jgi:Na+-transporting NADH:ubiquinone oxidoreductase subunit A
MGGYQLLAILGMDYVGMKPKMLVAEGDKVKLGQALFEDKKNPGVIFTAPGTVNCIVNKPVVQTS